MSPRFCPHCGTPQQPGAVRCPACDRLLREPVAVAAERTFVETATPFVMPTLKPPGADAWPIMWTLVGLCASASIVLAMTGNTDWIYASLTVGLLLLLAQLFLWYGGHANARKGAAFLGSDRTLVRWVYTPEEWRQVCNYFYEQMTRDPLPWGCMPAIFGLTGLLTGLLIGAEDGLEHALVGTLIGAALGGGFGGALVLPVRLINRTAAERVLHAEMPAAVAIGTHELFYARVYLNAHAFFVSLRGVRLVLGTPPHLSINYYAPRWSLITHFPSMIIVPARMLPAVQEALPRMEVKTQQGEDAR
ncbi:MAG: zinc ribbon domain-containing protein, partial [Chloroflexales bacterium]